MINLRTNYLHIVLISLFIVGCASDDKTQTYTKVYLIGDSTMADYTGDYDPGKDYMKTRYPVTQ